jgi:CDGSH-type Zn-finger protein
VAERDGGLRISVAKDGPYVVEGGVPLTREAIEPNRLGESWEWRLIERIEVDGTYRLCRCGKSAEQPVCDDSCATNGFDGTERPGARPYADMARTFRGPDLDLTDAPQLCATARFCDARGSVWTQVEAGGEASTRFVQRAVRRCPSGRLVAWPHGEAPERGDGDGPEASSLEPVLEPSIALIEDPQNGVSGAVWVRGRIPVTSATGERYEVRNRITLCRCGASRNKPFCDGSHIRIRFTDRIAEPEG